MVRSLWTAASGMNSQQFNIDTISNNISNVNTTGFKKTRAEFEDLLYQNLRMAGTPSSSISNYPTGIHVGLGSKTASTQKIFEQGAPQSTGVKTDLAIAGEGFFKVQMYDGTEAYTRDGAWKIDANRQIVNHSGYRLVPKIVLPENFQIDSLSISEDGRVTCKVGGSDEQIEVGNIELYRFVNPAGLTAIGGNLFKTSEASGNEIAGVPGFDGMGKLYHGFIEMSNVKVVEEMVSMIVAQRAYELNSKAVQTSDSMLNTAVNLKR